MNSWYYSQADQAIGPFRVEILSKLLDAGVIGEATPVRQAEETEWRSLASVLTKEIPDTPAPAKDEARYFYLDADNQPVGPFNVVTLRRLHAEAVLSPDTLVSAIGDTEWIPAAHLLGLPPISPPAPMHSGIQEGVHPRRLSFEQYVLMIGVTLSFYQFYLVPFQSRDMKAITGRERMEFTALLILGIVTLSLVLLVMQVLWAYDLERHGKAIAKAGRTESLGTLVLVLTVLGVILSFAIESFALGFLVGAALAGSALWLLQREINLYAAPSAANP